jgi:hypothetical protein
MGNAGSSRRLLLVLYILLACSCGQRTKTFEDKGECPAIGSAKTAHLAKLNQLKNRTTMPQQSDFNAVITLAEIVRPGFDKDRWSSDQAARITGYVYDVKPGGIETCNCKAGPVDERDTHIELVVDPMQSDKTKRVVVEVTPRIRKIMKEKGEDWRTSFLRDKLLGRWVTFEGWLLFDGEHASQRIPILEENAIGGLQHGKSTR